MPLVPFWDSFLVPLLLPTMWQPGRKLAVGSTILITPLPPPLGTVTHMCHDVVPATLSSVGERTLYEWSFRSVLGVIDPNPS